MKSSTIILLVFVSLGGIAGVVIGMQPPLVKEEKSIVIKAPAPVIYRELTKLLDKLQWSGTKGKDPQWIEEQVVNERIKCGLTEEGFEKTCFLLYQLKSSSDGKEVTLTSTFEADVRDLGDRMVWLYAKSKIATLHEEILTAVRNASEQQSLSPVESLTTDSDNSAKNKN